MGQEVRFMSVINNSRNWSNNTDFEGIDENTIKLKDILGKMYFERYPEHPKLFVKMFSDQDLIDRLLNSMIKVGITNLNKVWFRECSDKEKDILIKKGILKASDITPGTTNIAIARNEQDCFINVFL